MPNGIYALDGGYKVTVTGGSFTSGGLAIVGDSLSNATDSGSAPVKIGAVYNLSPVTLTDGQRTNVQADAKGRLINTPAIGALTTLADGVTNTPLQVAGSQVGSGNVNYYTAEMGHKFNGTTWDRDRKPNGTKILPSSAATTNPDFAKASAGDFWCVSGFNASAAVKYLKVFNKASAPTVGTDNPVMVIALPVGAFNMNFGGHYLGTGIAFALTGAPALLDTTALASGDIVGLTLTYA